MQTRNWVIFVTVVLIWGSNWVAQKSGLESVGPLNFVMQRALFAAVALYPFLIIFRKKIPKDRNTLVNISILGLINAAGMISTNIGLAHEQVGVSAVLTYTQSLFVFCLAVPFLRQETSLGRFLGTALGFFGVVVLYLGRYSSFAGISLPVLALLTGAFFWALRIVFYKRFLYYVNPVIVTTMQFTLDALILLPLTWFFEGVSFKASGSYIFIIAYTSIIGSAIAVSLWLHLIREEEATVVTSSSLIIPIVALVLGALFFQEVMKLESILGSIFILMGVYLVNKN